MSTIVSNSNCKSTDYNITETLLVVRDKPAGNARGTRNMDKESDIDSSGASTRAGKIFWKKNKKKTFNSISEKPNATAVFQPHKCLGGIGGFSWRSVCGVFGAEWRSPA